MGVLDELDYVLKPANAAQRASDEEADRAFEIAATFYPGYGKYRARASHRTISVFVLEPPR